MYHTFSPVVKQVRFHKPCNKFVTSSCVLLSPYYMSYVAYASLDGIIVTALS